MNSKTLQNWAPEVQSHGWPAIILQIGVATLVSGAIAYVATNPQQLPRTGTVSAGFAPLPRISVPAPAQAEPVLFRNPFDSTETFQFPAGTSETEARQAVAEVLLQRARERKDVWLKARHSAHPSRRAAEMRTNSDLNPSHPDSTTG